MTVCVNDGVYSKPPAISSASTAFHALTYSVLWYIKCRLANSRQNASGEIDL